MTSETASTAAEVDRLAGAAGACGTLISRLGYGGLRWGRLPPSGASAVPAAELGAGAADTESTGDVFVRDTATNTTRLVSHALDDPGRASSGADPAISADGTTVTFTTPNARAYGDERGAEGPSPHPAVLVWHGATGAVEIITRTADGRGIAHQRSSAPVVSPDGSIVAFLSEAENLVTGISDPNQGDRPGSGYYGAPDVYLWRREGSRVELVSRSSGGPDRTADRSSHDLRMSRDGRHLFFASDATDLVAGVADTNRGVGPCTTDLFDYDIGAGRISAVSVDDSRSGTGTLPGCSEDARPSGDGAHVAFSYTRPQPVPATVDIPKRRIPARRAVNDPPAANVAPPARDNPAGGPHAGSGYWLLARDGTVTAFGSATDHDQRSMTGPAVDIETLPGGGYLTIDEQGRVQSSRPTFPYAGLGPPALPPGERVTSLSVHPEGGGYWLFTSTGRVLPYGYANHFGDMTGIRLNGPVLDSVATPTGRGYFMVAADGGVFTFGDAQFAGSMGATRLNAPVQSLVPDPDGDGYWLVAEDGGVFSFSAPFRGSMGSVRLNAPVTGMIAFGNGYLMVATDGGIFNFSDRPFSGSLGATGSASPIVAVAASGRPGR